MSPAPEFERFGPVGVVPNPVAAPGDHNMVGWTFDPRHAQAGTLLPASGTLNVARIKPISALVTNIMLHMTAGGATLTSGLAGLYTDAGALVAAQAVTADQATNWAGGGMKTMALTAPQAVTPGAWYKVAWFAVGGTMPTLTRDLNSSTAILNANLSSPNFMYATADTGLTTTLPNNLGAQTGGATAWWVGLS